LACSNIIVFRCDTIEKLRLKLPALEAEIQDAMKFRDVYQFTFNYAKNPGQKGLDLDMAIAYWNIILHGRFKFLDLWCRYLQVFLILSYFILYRYQKLHVFFI
jgi:Cullin binding